MDETTKEVVCKALVTGKALGSKRVVWQVRDLGRDGLNGRWRHREVGRLEEAVGGLTRKLYNVCELVRYHSQKLIHGNTRDGNRAQVYC